MSTPRPSGEDLSRGEARLQEALAGLRGGLEGERDRFFQLLDAAFTTPMRDAFVRARKAHEELLKGVGLPASGEGEDPSSTAEVPGIRGYRMGVRKEVLEPLRETLLRLDAGGGVADRWEGFLGGLAGLGETLPERILRKEPPDLFRPRPQDSPVQALRKLMVRGWRRSVQVLKPRPRAQTLPLRKMGSDWLGTSLPLAMAGLEEELQQLYAKPLRRVGAAVSRWSEGWPRMEEGEISSAGAALLELISRNLPPPDPSGEDPGEIREPSQGVPDSGHDDAHEVCLLLDRALSEASGLEIPASLLERWREKTEAEWERWLEELRVSGTFQASSPRAGDASRLRRFRERRAARVSSWKRWHGGILDRIHLALVLLRLKETFESVEERLSEGIAGGVLQPRVESCIRVKEGLEGILESGEEVFSSRKAATDLPALAGGVETLLERARTVLEEGILDPLPLGKAEGLARKAGDEAAAQLADALQGLPETLWVPVGNGKEGPVEPSVARRALPLREVAQMAVDILRIEELRTSPEALMPALEAFASLGDEVSGIAAFNLTAARDGLLNPPEGVLSRVVEDARTLTLDGLRRTRTGMDKLLDEVARGWEAFDETLRGRLHRSYMEIHSRAVAEGAVQEQMLGLKARIKGSAREGLEALEEWGRRAERWLARWRKKVGIRTTRLIRLGRSAVGAPVDPEKEADRALQILRRVPGLLEGLPLVYRRLYPFQPLADASLLVGREEERRWVARRLEEWKAGHGVPLILTGPVASGHTSLLNALSAEELQDYRVVRLELTDRPRDADAVAPVVAAALGWDAGEALWTLDGLADRIQASFTRKREPTAFMVEHLEHLLLRTPGGTELLAEFLSFQARTSEEILWLSTLPGAAWKFFAKSEPRAAGLATQTGMSPLSVEELEELILTRHRRSGMPLEFLQPVEASRLLRRRLRRTLAEEARQEILRKECFERIHRMSEGSIAMAILSWLRSADFSTREGWLRISAPRPIRFAFLDGLDLEMDFALKAFLEHGSLTLGEYVTIFRSSEDEAFRVFEALVTRFLLEPVGAPALIPLRPAPINGTDRYRIPGLLSQVVAARLKNLNILH